MSHHSNYNGGWGKLPMRRPLLFKLLYQVWLKGGKK